jgi:streptomycin 6-kinase
MTTNTRLDERARAWEVNVSHVRETENALLGFGSRGSEGVVLKIPRRPGDEWRSGEILHAFDGRGVVRVREYVDGAVLLERLSPGRSLVPMVLEGHDDDAVDIIADVIRQMVGRTPPACPTLQDWGKAFERYLATGDRSIPPDLVENGRDWFVRLTESQQNPTLLHGDLQHDNVLFDATRGWLAIDPKGVVGEVEYEIGAVLRNPIERPDLFLSAAAVERRLSRFARRLTLDMDRVLQWAFAQAVLSAIWIIEDGAGVESSHPALRLARLLQAMLPWQG